MVAAKKYPAEMKERAVRLVQEVLEADPAISNYEAVKRIGSRLNIPYGTLRTWYHNYSSPQGTITRMQPTAEAVRIKELEREVKELKRANEILKAASAFFARELDPKLPF